MMKATLMLSALGLMLSASSVHAVTTITDCTAAPVQISNKKTVVSVNDDVVIQCALMSLPGSDQTQVTAKSIVIDGPAGGSVSSSGKGGQATLLNATMGDVTIDAASVVAANSNGTLVVQATGNVAVTPGSSLSAGDVVEITCTGALCTIDIATSTINSNKVRVNGQGTVTVVPASTITTTCPRDEVRITSAAGDVVLSGGTLGGLSTICCNVVQANCTTDPNGAGCPFAGGGTITLNNLQELSAFCTDCDQSPNVIQTCIEGNVYIDAPLGSVDAHNAIIRAGETILINALSNVDLQNAQVSNCGPKTGVVVVTSATCNSIAGATILDDAPDVLPTLNCATSGVAALLGTCSNQQP